MDTIESKPRGRSVRKIFLVVIVAAIVVFGIFAVQRGGGATKTKTVEVTVPVYNFKLSYPQDWKVDSDKLSKSKTPLKALQDSASQFTINQDVPKNGLEATVSILPTSMKLEDILKQDSDYKQLTRKTFNKIDWSWGELPLAGNQGNKVWRAAGLIAKSFDDTKVIGDHQVIQLTVKNYTGFEKDLENLIKSIKFI